MKNRKPAGGVRLPSRPLLVAGAAQDEVVFVHRRPAARRVGDDGVIAARQEHLDVALRQPPGLPPQPQVHVQRPAAGLPRRHHHLAAVLLQHPDGGLVQAGQADVGHAARQKRHAVPPLALRGKRLPDVAVEEGALDGRRQPLKFA